jgi:hypothetical protein
MKGIRVVGFGRIPLIGYEIKNTGEMKDETVPVPLQPLHFKR